MFVYSTLLRPIFWVVMGLLYALIIAGSKIWAQDLGLEMSWWKWVLAGLWYGFLSLGCVIGFTLIGEKEIRAGYFILGANFIASVILGAGLWFLF